MRKRAILLLAGVTILLCSCGTQNQMDVAAESTTLTEATSEQTTTEPETAGVETAIPQTAARETRAAADKVPLIDIDQFSYEKPDKMSYEEVVSRAVGKVTEEEGTFGGSPVIWSTISDKNYVYFFYRFIGKVESDEQELSDYAIVGAQIELACGISTGMSIEEAEDLLPGLYHFQWDQEEENSMYRWNPAAYPEGWAEQFPTILLAQVDYDGELPVYIGFMADETKTIRAMGFCSPTAG